MNVEYKKSKVISNEKIIDNIYKIVCEEDNTIKPGQFYMFKLKGRTLLPRPISICEKDGNKIIFYYAVNGEGTKEYSNLNAGDYLELTGPLGNGFDLSKDLGKVAVVVGGIGNAPMVEVMKQLRNKDKNQVIDAYMGFRDNGYLTEEFAKYASSVNIATDTGKNGHKGFVTDLLKPEEYDTVLCCGPEIMMKKVIGMCKEKNTKIYVSMEKHMACGVGACLVCTCKTKDGFKRTCTDGPVFDGYYVEL